MHPNLYLRALVTDMVEEVTALMDKLHVLVIGTGLGRCPIVLEATSRIILEARSRKLPMVLDADALYLLTLEPYQRLFHNELNVPVVLTPNAMELKRLQGMSEHWSKDCVVIEKGNQDTIRRGGVTGTRLLCDEKGGLKRPGGLGDVLAGTLGTVVAWNGILTKRKIASIDDLPLSCWTACCMVKRATRRAFEEHYRSMTAPDVLVILGTVVNEMTVELEAGDIVEAGDIEQRQSLT
jgi:ATP-dependent NAD(P)H-hydrate dehydratase